MSDNPFKDALNFARLGEETRRALRPKKKFKNKHFKRMTKRIKRDFR